MRMCLCVCVTYSVFRVDAYYMYVYLLFHFHLHPYVCVCTRVCLSVCMSGLLSVCLSVRLSFCSSVCLYVCPSVRLFVCRPSVCPSVCLSVCSYVRLSVCPSVRLFVCPSVLLSVQKAYVQLLWISSILAKLFAHVSVICKYYCVIRRNRRLHVSVAVAPVKAISSQSDHTNTRLLVSARKGLAILPANSNAKRSTRTQSKASGTIPDSGNNSFSRRRRQRLLQQLRSWPEIRHEQLDV